MKFHTHQYKFNCKMSDGHNHRLLGYAGNMTGVDRFHFHFYYGISSYRDHTHYFCGITGMPVKTENGHIHKMEGSLETNSLHEHKFGGYTFEDTSNYTSKQAVTIVQ